MLKELFKKETREEYVGAFISGICFQLKNRDFTPSELLRIQEATTKAASDHIVVIAEALFDKSEEIINDYAEANRCLTELNKEG